MMRKTLFMSVPFAMICIMVGFIFGLAVAKATFKESDVWIYHPTGQRVFCNEMLAPEWYKFVERKLVPKHTIQVCLFSGPVKQPGLR